MKYKMITQKNLLKKIEKCMKRNGKENIYENITIKKYIFSKILNIKTMTMELCNNEIG